MDPLNGHLTWLTSTVLQGLITQGDPSFLPDVVFVCQGGSVSFYRWILGITSSLFSTLFSTQDISDCDVITIILPDFDVATVKRFLQVLCTGETTIPSESCIEEISSFCDCISLKWKMVLNDFNQIRCPDQIEAVKKSRLKKRRLCSVDEVQKRSLKKRRLVKDISSNLVKNDIPTAKDISSAELLKNDTSIAKDISSTELLKNNILIAKDCSYKVSIIENDISIEKHFESETVERQQNEINDSSEEQLIELSRESQHLKNVNQNKSETQLENVDTISEEKLNLLKVKTVHVENLKDQYKPSWKTNFESGQRIYKLCYICPQSFVGLHQFMIHLRTHSQDSGPYKCPNCPREFSSGLPLHDHMRRHYKGEITSDGVESYSCPTCSKRFRTKGSVMKHNSKYHSSKKRKKFCCSEANCSFSCHTLRSYSDHLVKQHQKKPYQCKLCGIEYMHKSNLSDHMDAKHGDEGANVITCDVCGKKFPTRANFLVHRRDQHELGDKRLLKCNICSFVSKGRRNLKKHQEIHDEASHRKFQCFHCSKMFRSKNSLVVHERIHTGEAPYKCLVCQVDFKRLHHLYSHLKTASHSSKISQLESEGKTILPNEICFGAKDGRTS